MKFFQDFTVEKIDGRRTPHGVRGLKFGQLRKEGLLPTVAPSRGAWIEIGMVCNSLQITPKSHPSRGAWIEIDCR